MAQPKREPEESDNHVPELGKRIKIKPSDNFENVTQLDHVKSKTEMYGNVGRSVSGGVGKENTIQIKTGPSPKIIPEKKLWDQSYDERIVTLEPKVRQLAEELHKYRTTMWVRHGMQSFHHFLPNGILFNLSYNPPATFEEIEIRLKGWRENAAPLHENTIKSGRKLLSICIGEKTADEITSRICLRCMKDYCVSYAKCKGKRFRQGHQLAKYIAAKRGVGPRDVVSANVRRGQNRRGKERKKRKRQKQRELESFGYPLIRSFVSETAGAELNPNAKKSTELANVAFNAEGVLNYGRDVSTRSGSNFDNVPVEGRRRSHCRMLGDDKMKEHTNWTKPKRIWVDPGIAMPIIHSEIQETDAKIDEVKVDEDWKPKMIPFEDIPDFTCVEDHLNKSWPIPQTKVIKPRGGSATGSGSIIVSVTGGFPSNNPPPLIHQQLPPQQFHPSQQYQRQFETERDRNGTREGRYYRKGDRDGDRDSEYDRRSSPVSRSYIRGRGETLIGPTTTIAELTRSSSTDVIMIEPSRNFLSNTRPKYTESAF